MEDRCVMCGEIIPEGRMVCSFCGSGQSRRTEKVKCDICGEVITDLWHLACNVAFLCEMEKE